MSKNSGSKRRLWIVLLSVAFVAALVSVFGFNYGQNVNKQASNLILPPVMAASVETAPDQQFTYAAVVARVAPAVVTVRSERHVAAQQQNPLASDPGLREFFGDRNPQGPQQPRGGIQRGLGSGVVVSSDGYILTNNHVIDGAEEIKVDLTDKRTFVAKLVGTDAPSDLAMLKINAKDLLVLPLGNSDAMRIGDPVLAVGNPLGVGQTVTAGIISAKGRSTGLSDGSYEDFLQTDAPINQGNSGGALVNINGELIGINSQILSPSGGNIGIGFAIPSNMAKGVMEQLVKNGQVHRGQIGVGIQSMTSELAEGFGLKEVRGVIVNSVSQGSPAERAGIKQGDVILAVNGNSVNDGNTLRNMVAGTLPGTEVTLTILRDGQEQQVRCTLNELSTKGNSGEEQSGRDGDNNSPKGGKYGLSVAPLTPEMATQLGLEKSATGLLVNGVNPTSPASDAGLQPGDLILQANRQVVATVEELKAALERSGSHPVLLLINRQGHNIFLTIRQP